MSKITIKARNISNSKNKEDINLLWDIDAGTVSGLGADYILNVSSYSSIPIHPFPGVSHALSSEPLKNMTDMAAMVGLSHKLPLELIDHYPKYVNNENDGYAYLYSDESSEPIKVPLTY